MHTASRKLREKIASGRPVFGTMMVEFTSPAAVSVTVSSGFDFTIVDGEHGNQNPREVETTIEAGWQAGLCTLMRPPDTNRAVITRSLDAGAGGLLVPFCSTMEEVHQAVRASKYPPVGQRGTHLMRGHTRHQSPDTAAFLAEANRDLLTLIQVELEGALLLVDQIAATEGVDGLYIGPGDLSVALGVPGQWRSPVVLEAIRATAEACKRHGKIMGCHVNSVDDVPHLREVGVQLFGYSCDIAMYRAACQEVAREFRSALKLA